MKQLLVLLAILAVSAGALYLAQRSRRHDAVSTDAVLDAAAEMERDLSRAPMHLTRLSDESEIRIGNELAVGYLSAEPPRSAEMESVEKYVSKVGDHLAVRTSAASVPFSSHHRSQLDQCFCLTRRSCLYWPWASSADDERGRTGLCTWA